MAIALAKAIAADWRKRIADQDKSAANFANEHESEMIRALRVDSRLIFCGSSGTRQLDPAVFVAMAGSLILTAMMGQRHSCVASLQD